MRRLKCPCGAFAKSRANSPWVRWDQVLVVAGLEDDLGLGGEVLLHDHGQPVGRADRRDRAQLASIRGSGMAAESRSSER